MAKVYAPQDGQIQVHQSRVSFALPTILLDFLVWWKDLDAPATQAKDRAQDPPRVVDAAQAPSPSHELEAEPIRRVIPLIVSNIFEVVSSPVSTPERNKVWTACPVWAGCSFPFDVLELGTSSPGGESDVRDMYEP